MKDLSHVGNQNQIPSRVPNPPQIDEKIRHLKTRKKLGFYDEKTKQRILGMYTPGLQTELTQGSLNVFQEIHECTQDIR